MTQAAATANIQPPPACNRASDPRSGRLTSRLSRPAVRRCQWAAAAAQAGDSRPGRDSAKPSSAVPAAHGRRPRARHTDPAESRTRQSSSLSPSQYSARQPQARPRLGRQRRRAACSRPCGKRGVPAALTHAPALPALSCQSVCERGLGRAADPLAGLLRSCSKGALCFAVQRGETRQRRRWGHYLGLAGLVQLGPSTQPLVTC